MGKGASNYQTSGGLRLPYISGWNQNEFINPIAKRVQQQSGYDPDYYYGTDEEPGEYEKASLENRPINFEGGFASKKMQRDAQQYLQEYDQYNQFLENSENYGNIMVGRQFKYGSNLYERQGLIPSMYASSLGRYYKNGGNIDYSMYDVFQHGTYPNGGDLNISTKNKKTNTADNNTIVAKPSWYQEPVVNPAAYVSGFRGGNPNMYKYGFLTTNRGNVVGGGGLGFPKSGIELSGLGVVPTSPDERQYFKGFYDAKISKDVNKNINLGLGAGAAITGYPGENGFVMNPIQLQPNVSLKYNFKTGGMIKRADGSYSQRGLWDNIRANKGSGKKPTAAMLAQERKINNQKANGGYLSSFKASNIQTY